MVTMLQEHVDPKVGVSSEFDLRVSVAVLTATYFHHPDNNDLYIVLERKSSSKFQNGQINTSTQAQPIGGACVIKNIGSLYPQINGFSFDSEESRNGSDLRIFISKSSWSELKRICIEEFSDNPKGIIEAYPEREFAEEIHDATGINVSADQIRVSHIGIHEQNNLSASPRMEANNAMTARIFNVFAIEIVDKSLIDAVIKQNNISTAEVMQRSEQKAKATSSNAKATALMAVKLSQNYCFQDCSISETVGITSQLIHQFLLPFDK